VTLDDDALRRAFAGTAHDARFRDDCPTADDLWAAARGEAAPVTTAAVVDHLASCPACGAAWQAALEFGPLEARATPSPRASGWTAPPWAMAAMVILAVGLGAALVTRERSHLRSIADAAAEQARLSGELARERDVRAGAQQENARLTAELDRRSRPLVNVPLFELAADELRGGRTAAPLDVPRDASHVTVILAPPRALRGDRFVVEAVDAAGRTAWRAERLRPTAANVFTLTVDRASMPDGSYRLRLVDAAAEPPALVHEYLLAIRGR
jgi:hypothetical protein